MQTNKNKKIIKNSITTGKMHELKEEKLTNFDEIVNRWNTNAMNTDGFRGYIFNADKDAKFAFADEEFIRMWVADMEFAVAPGIRAAIQERLDRKILGYTAVTNDEYYKVFSKWCQEKYGLSFPEEQLAFSPGVVPAVIQLVELLVGKGEKALTQTPGYNQFKKATDYNGVELVVNPLKYVNGKFEMDFEDFEKKAEDKAVKLVILCNPQNPTGKIWTVEELKKIAAIVEKNDLWIISDEIHCDLTRTGLKHTSMGLIMPDYRKLITCFSASKSFNIAGLMMSNIIIRDAELKKKFVERDKLGGCMNPLSIAAQKAAYEKGAEWLNELRVYLDGNFKLVKEILDKELPKTNFTIPDATYLAWVNFEEYLADEDNLPLFFANKAGVLLEGGDRLFIGNASKWVRLNLAMPRAILEEGMNRIVKAIKAR